MQTVKCFLQRTLIFSSVILSLFCYSKVLAAKTTVDVGPTPQITVKAPLKRVLSQEEISQYVARESKSYGVNPVLALWIANKESQFNPEAKGDHGTSYGLWQIHLPAHPNITVAQATDPIWSTEWALTQILDGRVDMWSTVVHCHDWYPGECPL